jgi:hypothetical protein
MVFRTGMIDHALLGRSTPGARGLINHARTKHFPIQSEKFIITPWPQCRASYQGVINHARTKMALFTSSCALLSK